MWDKLFPKGIYLYNAGDENFDVTGGWGMAGTCVASPGAYTRYGTLTRYADWMNLKASGGSYAYTQISTANLINLTDCNKIRIDYSIKSGNAPSLCLLTSRNQNLMDVFPRITLDASKTTLEFDVSLYSGAYCVGIYYQHYNISVDVDIFLIQLLYE